MLQLKLSIRTGKKGDSGHAVVVGGQTSMVLDILQTHGRCLGRTEGDWTNILSITLTGQSEQQNV